MTVKTSPHFERGEFACGCGCGFDRIKNELLLALECVREHFGAPVTVNSACRCESHNRAAGGEPASRHLLGEAADITVEGAPPDEVADYCESLIGDRGGVGRYSTFTHVDVRGARARWRG